VSLVAAKQGLAAFDPQVSLEPPDQA